MLYLDTSAFLKLYIKEESSKLVQSFVAAQDDPLPVWDALEMELTSALWLKVFRKELPQSEVGRLLALFAERRVRGLYFTPQISRAGLMDRFHELARHTPQTGCRTMDIVHVAAAMEVGADTFVSFDERQSKLARLSGLVCLPHVPARNE